MQEKCLQYLKDKRLFDPANPTEVTVDDIVRESLGLSVEGKVTLFDFVDRIRELVALMRK